MVPISVESNSLIASTVYDFSTTGPGTFTFDPVSRFRIAGLSSTAKTISDATRLDADNVRSVSITVTGDVSKHDTLYCDDFKHVWAIYTGFTEAKSMASIAASYISSRGATDPVYKAYFGSNPTSRIIFNFNTIANQDLSLRALSCWDAHTRCKNDTAAYSVDGTIYYCNNFHHLSAADSLCEGDTVGTRHPRGAITLRELTLVLGQAVDVGSGCSYVQTIPDSYKSDNAENYKASTPTARGLPRTYVLIRGCDLCSASLPRSTKTPSAKWIVEISEGEGFRVVYVCTNSTKRDRWPLTNGR